MLLQLFHVWRDFFIVTATAGATLIGAMFVVVSIAVGILTRDRSAAAHAYLTSTLVHLGAVLLASLLTMAPSVTWLSFAVVLTVGGAIGVVYVAVLATTVHRFRVDWTDTLWYTGLPVIGYAGLAAAGILGFIANFHAVELLAAASVLVLICGVHNAWDMILAFAARPRPPAKE
ncbi:MAG TPA: hypothetical protein VID77_13600 [Stellaceae bacterium]